MAHEVETMAYGGATPWHQIGTAIPEEQRQDWRVVMALAGLDWKVVKVPVITADASEKVPGGYATRRESDARVFGCVGEDYTIWQNEQLFQWCEPLLRAGLKMECAGALREGSRVFALCSFPDNESEVGPGDNVKAYVLVAHAHDGTLAIHCGLTATRVVCANTLRAAIMRNGEATINGSELLRVKHTSGVQLTMERVRNVLDLAQRSFVATMDQYRVLAHAGDVKRDDLRRFVRIVLDLPAEPERDEKLSTRKVNQVDEIERLFLAGTGQRLDAARGTWWGAYNAATEYLTHGRAKDRESALLSNEWGDGAGKGRVALETALQFAGVR